MSQRTINTGGYRVTRLFDGTFEAPLKVFIHQQGEAACQAALQRWGGDALRIPVHCFLLQGERGPILIDAGAGTGWGPKFGSARAEMTRLGVDAADIETVLITHFHGDHALGLLDPDGQAFFANAQVIAPADDLDHYTDPEARAHAPKERRSGFDIVAGIVPAYGDRLKPARAGDVLPGISLVPLPGHSPGHSGYFIEGPDRALLLWGDAMHIADLQLPDPEVGLIFDYDPTQTIRSRREVLERLASTDEIVAGGHLTGFHHVRRSETGFSIVDASA
ncbi:MAG: MBL fold metallo-hydrolase [Pseudomonadota bacterium]